MWDTYRLPTLGNFSLRQIVVSFLAVIMSALFLTISHSAVAAAADASWQGDNISYNAETYQPESGTIQGVPAGTQVYSLKNTTARTAKVIYIPAGADMTKEVQAQALDCTISPANAVSCPTQGRTISLDAKKDQKEKTQCDVAGVGWIVCIISRFIADGMDKIFSIIASYLEVKPITTDTDSGLFQAWSMARSIANLAFVVAFLVIIYSQITTIGFSNYNIKKMIPRLIVAAILVNISYYVCSIAVDLSNILGHSVQQALINIRTALPNPAPESLDSFSWKNITEYILSGGTIVAAGFAAKAAFLGGAAGGSISGLAFLLFPILVTGALAVLVAVLILAARQALITILIIVSPLAFVAYLLPNTEKWFEKWRELFTTMLLVFPMFSLLFGGSQLASYLIIQNADQISVVIFAMFIQVAPLVLTPFLIKFSGSLLGRIAGMVNDPKRGIVDRARNWSTDKAEVQRAKGQIAAQKGGGTRFQRQAYKRELDKQNRSSWKKAGEAHVDAGWHQDPRYTRHHASISEAEIIKKAGETSAERHFEHRKAQDANLQRYIGRTRVNQDAIKALEQEEERAYSEVKTSATLPPNHRFSAIRDEAKVEQRRIDVAESALASAKAMQREDFGKALIRDEALQANAGGVAGAERALAVGVSEYRKAYGDKVNEAAAILKHFNLSGTDRQNHAMGITVEAKDADGNIKILRADSQFTREAAIEQQLATGTYLEATQIIEASATGLAKYRTTIQEAVAQNKLGQKAVFYGGQTINDIGQGRVVGSAGVDEAVLRTFMQGKISAGDLATNDVGALERMWSVIGGVEAQVTGGTPPAGLNVTEFNDRLTALRTAAGLALTNRSISGSVKDNAREVLEAMRGTSTP
jgi:hypothetical protein